MIPAVFSVATAVFASGCIAATTLINVKADASGTIDQTIVITKAAIAQMQQMSAMGQAAGGAGNKPQELFSEAELRNAANTLGEGVTFVSSQKIKNAEGEGVKALYSFTDIRKLRLNQRPNMPGGAMPGIGGQNVSNNLTFGFSSLPTGNSVVSIVFPGDTGRQTMPSRGRGEQVPPEALAMFKQMFKGLRIDIALQVDGRIVKTNSPYVEGSRVTLLAVDFEQLLSDPSILADLQQNQSVDAMRSRLAGVKGVKVPPENEVRVEFAR